MAQLTAAQKKAIAEANALKAKLQKQLAEQRAQKAALTPATGQGGSIAEELRLKQVAADAASARASQAELAKQAAAIAANKGFNTIGGQLYYNNTPFSGAINGKTYVNGVEGTPASGVSGLSPKGSKTFQMLGGTLYFDGEPFNGTAPQDGMRYINGISYGKAIPEAVEPAPLASDTFKNTLAIMFGQAEVSKPWADGLYKSVSKFVKTGSTVDEAFNLAFTESRNDPTMKPFTDRFKAIYAIQDLKATGRAIEVPTIAEYVKSEAAAGDILRSTGLGSLATEEFLSGVFSKGVDVKEFTDRITAVFDRIDTAPDVIKKVMAEKFPYVDRTSLAKALLTGDTGAKALQEQVKGFEVLAAAQQQGVRASKDLPSGITEAQAANYAASGQTFATAVSGFGQVAQARETEQKLAEISGQQSMGVAGLSDAILGKNVGKLSDIEKLTLQEENRFKGRSGVGTLASSQRNQVF